MAPVQLFPPGFNARAAFPNHRERGPVSWRYTYEDVAACVGLKAETVQKHAAKGLVDMESLLSIAKYIHKRLAQTVVRTVW